MDQSICQIFNCRQSVYQQLSHRLHFPHRYCSPCFRVERRQVNLARQSHRLEFCRLRFRLPRLRRWQVGIWEPERWRLVWWNQERCQWLVDRQMRRVFQHQHRPNQMIECWTLFLLRFMEVCWCRFLLVVKALGAFEYVMSIAKVRVNQIYWISCIYDVHLSIISFIHHQHIALSSSDGCIIWSINCGWCRCCCICIGLFVLGSPL